jgi:hypothetical protein
MYCFSFTILFAKIICKCGICIQIDRNSGRMWHQCNWVVESMHAVFMCGGLNSDTLLEPAIVQLIVWRLMGPTEALLNYRSVGAHFVLWFMS